VRLRHLWPIQDRIALAKVAAQVAQANLPPDLDAQAQAQEWTRCAADRAYFIRTYCRIYDAEAQDWIPFTLWEAQETTLATLAAHPRTVILKARQLGLSWLLLCYILHGMLFCPVFTALIFSKREEEAKYLIGPERLQGIYQRLPAWMQARARPVREGTKTWTLMNGSTVTAFPANGGDGRTASLAFADEFDLLDSGEQNSLLTAVKPTVEKGQFVLLSKVNKKEPNSPFKKIYEGAKAGANEWTPVFLPWHVRPARTAAWYAAIAGEIKQRTGATDELYENYPATEAEALAGLSLDKRLPADWLLACYSAAPALHVPGAPAIPLLEVYAPPVFGERYCAGADPAEGNPTSDQSALTVVNARTGAEVASLAGRYEIPVFAAHCALICQWYHAAPLLPERNNHGHAFILAYKGKLLAGTDGKPGWLTTAPSKALMYDTLATALREHDATIHNWATYQELGSIEGATLRAPEGSPDDRAVSTGLAHLARTRQPAPLQKRSYLTDPEEDDDER
jgi:hypothetical protein